MSEEKIKVGFCVAVDKGLRWKTEINLEDLGYLELHPGNIPTIGDTVVNKSDFYKVISRHFYKDYQTWTIILQKMN